MTLLRKPKIWTFNTQTRIDCSSKRGCYSEMIAYSYSQYTNKDNHLWFNFEIFWEEICHLRTHLCLRHQNEEQIFGLWHWLVFIHTGSEANNLIHAKWACLSNCPFYHTTSIKNNLPYLWGASTVWNLFLEWICHILARKNKMIISIKRGRVVAVIELAIPKNQAPQKSMKYVLINYRPCSLKKHSLTINRQSLLCGHKQRQGALLIGRDFMTLPWVSLPLNDRIIKDNQRMIR